MNNQEEKVVLLEEFKKIIGYIFAINNDDLPIIQNSNKETQKICKGVFEKIVDFVEFVFSTIDHNILTADMVEKCSEYIDEQLESSSFFIRDYGSDALTINSIGNTGKKVRTAWTRHKGKETINMLIETLRLLDIKTRDDIEEQIKNNTIFKNINEFVKNK